MDTKELCQWLRDNSAGIYRPARDAADLIPALLEKAERLERERDEAIKQAQAATRGIWHCSVHGWEKGGAVCRLCAEKLIKNQTTRAEEAERQRDEARREAFKEADKVLADAEAVYRRHGEHDKEQALRAEGFERARRGLRAACPEKGEEG